MKNKITCDLCPHHCKLSENQVGFCGARKAIGGRIRSLNYGKLTSLAMDPIEKKPLSYYKPGSQILSVGSFGCNMHCPFCQNYSIAKGKIDDIYLRTLSPQELIDLAISKKNKGNIGIAFTYNEPLIAFEFILDTAKIAEKEDLDIVIVTNGQIEETYLKKLLPYVSAWNIDLKCFTESGYKKLGGFLETTKRSITLAQEVSHVEVTTLIVPDLSDNPKEMAEEAQFLASLNPDLPLHLSRYFPSYKYNKPATDKKTIRDLKLIAKKYLNNVKLGNMY